ncbi:MAG: DNA repair exonuclease [Ruminococcaceae bacterium]|nr:DNA repair exonuclease [Oscillospiraceae bacterium]
MLKILHTGDIHLDCPFSSLNTKQAEIRRNELRSAFTSMMTYARMNQVDLVLIAGDLFDNRYATRETIALIKSEFEKMSCPIVITPGNHDYAGEKSIWRKNVFPKNVHVFADPVLSSVTFDEINTTVYGYGFDSPDMITAPFDGKQAEDPSRINILCAHCDMVSGNSTDCPVTRQQIERFGCDYAALGHIHNPPAVGRDNRYAYCGCLEGRGFDEQGPKGIIMAEIDKTPAGPLAEVRLKRIRFSKRRYQSDELSVEGAETQADVSRMIEGFISEQQYGEDTILRLRLTGAVTPGLVINTEEMAATGFGVFSLKLQDATTPVPDEETLLNDTSFYGELYRVLKPRMESEDEREREVALRAFRYAAAAVSGENIV